MCGASGAVKGFGQVGGNMQVADDDDDEIFDDRSCWLIFYICGE
jgi:hypothetical protein